MFHAFPLRTWLYWTASTVLAVLACAMTLLVTRMGPGLSPDSTYYLSSGMNMANGHGLTVFTGEPLTVFPPGLPFIVAVGEEVGLGAQPTLRLVNAISFGATVVLGAAILARRLSSSLRLATVGVALIATSPALLSVSSMAWSEPLFIVITLLFILVMERSLTSVNRVWWLVGGALLVWIAFLVRYAGIALVPAGVLTLLVGTWRVSVVAAFRSAATFAGLAVICPVAWMARNRSVDGAPLGPRYASADTPLESIERVFRTIGSWFAPGRVPGPVLGLLGATLVVGIPLAAAWFKVTNTTSGVPSAGSTLLPTTIFAAAYVSYVVAAQLLTAIDPINTRLLAPVFVPLVVLATTAADYLVEGAGARVCLGAVLLTLVSLHALQAFSIVRDGPSWGYPLLTADDSKLAAAVAELPSGARIYSNAPDAIWTLTGRQPVSQAPWARAPRSEETIEVPREFLDQVRCREVYLVWFEDSWRSHFWTPEDLREIVALNPVAQVDDGTVYRVSPTDRERNTPCEDPPNLARQFERGHSAFAVLA